MTRLKLAIVAAVTGIALTGWITHPALTVTLVTLLALTAGYGAWWRHQRAGSAALVQRWADRAKRHRGVANFWTILRVSSWWTLRRHARVLQPALTGRSWWTRWRSTPICRFGTRVIRTGWIWVMSAIEEHTLIFGAPRKGKSAYLACAILDAAGAVLVTSTGSDLVRNTSHLRSKVGPACIFNPANIGGILSTIGFNVLGGCEIPRIAGERAADLLSATPLAQAAKEREWLERATEALGAFMHAAALGGKTMHHVQRWVADPDAAAVQVLSILRHSPEPTIACQALQFFALGRPRSSVCMSIAPALSWLADPSAVACASNGFFNVERFLADRGTIYLLAERDSPIAPLITALAGHIARTARRIADRQPDERLEPGFTMALDEAPSICPLPLPAWASDMGKRNITMFIGAQSLSQVQDRWGEKAAGTLLTNCATKMVFGGTSDSAGLNTFFTLAGDLLSAAQIYRLPKLHAMVLRDGLLPVVGKPPVVWERSDYRAAKRAVAWQPRWSRLNALCRAPFARKAVMSRAPVREPLAALPAGGTAGREHAELLEQHGLR